VFLAGCGEMWAVANAEDDRQPTSSCRGFYLNLVQGKDWVAKLLLRVAEESRALGRRVCPHV